MKQTTPQTVIDTWRSHREERRPPECDHREGCWVVDPFGACPPDRRRNGAPRCNACGGKLAVDHLEGPRRKYPR